MTYWKYVAWWLVIVAAFAVRGCVNERSEKEDAVAVIGQRDQVLEVFYDNMRRQHNVIQERTFDLETLQHSRDSEIVALRAEYEGKLKDLQSRVVVYVRTTDTVKTTSTDTVRVTELGVDTGKTFTYHDDWSYIGGTLFGEDVDLTYSFRTGVRLDRKWMRPKWYKRKEMRLDVVMLNPYAELDGIQTITVKQDEKWYENRWLQCGASFLLGSYLSRR